ARIGLPAVDCSTSEVHAVPSQSRVFGLLTVFVPVFDRYSAEASYSAAFDWLQAMCGFPLESVEIVGMYPGYVSSTAVTAAQLALDASSACVGYVTVVFVYRTRSKELWSPVADADTHATWRYPDESIAIDGSAAAYP